MHIIRFNKFFILEIFLFNYTKLKHMVFFWYETIYFLKVQKKKPVIVRLGKQR
jgi:hypothetical protein